MCFCYFIKTRQATDVYFYLFHRSILKVRNITDKLDLNNWALNNSQICLVTSK